MSLPWRDCDTDTDGRSVGYESIINQLNFNRTDVRSRGWTPRTRVTYLYVSLSFRVVFHTAIHTSLHAQVRNFQCHAYVLGARTLSTSSRPKCGWVRGILRSQAFPDIIRLLNFSQYPYQSWAKGLCERFEWNIQFEEIYKHKICVCAIPGSAGSVWVRERERERERERSR